MYLLIADDLTGGNDAGIQFAKQGLRTRLALSAEGIRPRLPHGEEADILVVNTNTRNLPPAEAQRSVRALTTTLATTLTTALADSPSGKTQTPGLVFKKIDSTLRGNPGVEMDAIMEGFGFAAAFLAPSFPQQGRTVTGGELLVNGTPLHLTGFANDPLAPVRESSVAAIMAGQTRAPLANVSLAQIRQGHEALVDHIHSLLAQGVRCCIFDAENAEDLACIAKVGLTMAKRPLFIGSAGLAEAIAAHLAPSVSGAKGGSPFTAKAARIFFVCGSAHQTSHAQTEALASSGVPVIPVPETILTEPGASLRSAAELALALQAGDAALAAPRARIGEAGSTAEGLALSSMLADITLDALQRIGQPPESTILVMTGGETAYAILQRISLHLSLHAELLPGIALCSVPDGPWKGLRIVTKAGGFGTPETFVHLISLLRQAKAA